MRRVIDGGVGSVIPPTVWLSDTPAALQSGTVAQTPRAEMSPSPLDRTLGDVAVSRKYK